jgi:hypothetical protein
VAQPNRRDFVLLEHAIERIRAHVEPRALLLFSEGQSNARRLFQYLFEHCAVDGVKVEFKYQLSQTMWTKGRRGPAAQAPDRAEVIGERRTAP